MSKRLQGGQEKKEGSVAVAIDKDKGSQYAFKWAVDHLLTRGQPLTLLHVIQKVSSLPTPSGISVSISNVNEDVARTYHKQLETQTRELFLPFRCFCGQKDIKCNEVILEDMDITKALIEYISSNAIATLVLSASARTGLVKRFKTTDIPSSVSKGAPEFCNVYVISKGKISSVRPATAPAPVKAASVRNQLHNQPSQNLSDSNEAAYMNNQRLRAPAERAPTQLRNLQDDMDFRSPFTSGRASIPKYEPSYPESDISFVSSGRPSPDRMFPTFHDQMDYSGSTPRLSNGSGSNPRLSNGSGSNPRLSNGSGSNPRLSNGSGSNPRLSNGSGSNPRLSNGSGYPSEYEPTSFGSLNSGTNRSIDISSSQYEFSSSSQDNGSMASASTSQNIEDVEAEMRRLRLELKQTMEMYSAACKEALTAKQKAMELHRWRLEEGQRLEEAQVAEEAALALAEREKAKCRAAIEAAEAAQRIAELESHKRKNAEMKALKESEEKKRALNALANGDLRYRKYTIEEIEEATEYFSNSRKIGEGGYGPVYQCDLDHTSVAIKVLRPDAAQGRSQFQQEVEVLCAIRHPNMVLLLGACPEYGCLVYEYMANGSLDDRLFCRGGTPALSWQLRFRIAAEIGTGLLFLHQAKPEPIVHRDLKPGNILLDRNFVSKISDVGLARLVPPSVADAVTQYRMTSTAGTFCYIDPEYQQTGMLGIKSDIYSLGIMLLQIITAKPPMGLTHHVERAIEKGTFAEILDPAVPDWPVEEALGYAKLAIQCAELRKKDRPDLGKVILPELNRLRELAEETMPFIGGGGSSSSYSQVSTNHDFTSDSQSQQSGYESSRSRTSTSPTRRN
ncbi:hypothetical protein Q3G72_033726 [Acer saccharum]|nr:hypothetical protein Q3G72_033726 [Acer saccharum]